MRAVREWRGVVSTLVDNNDWGSSRVVVRVISVRTRPVVEVGKLVVVEAGSNRGNSLTKGQVVGDCTEVQDVLTVRGRNNLGVGVVVKSISLRTNEKVGETSTFTHRVKRTNSFTTLLNLDGNWSGCNSSCGSESRGSEGKLHGKNECGLSIELI